MVKLFLFCLQYYAKRTPSFQRAECVSRDYLVLKLRVVSPLRMIITIITPFNILNDLFFRKKFSSVRGLRIVEVFRMHDHHVQRYTWEILNIT